MPKQLPVKLGKEPLLEAVCELRVSPATGALHTILPGYFYIKYPDEITSLEHLPLSGMPDSVRQQEPRFANVALVRLTWRNYFILIGTRQIGLACKMPYPGWEKFKADILLLLGDVLRSKLIAGIDRYSVKYVNFFPSADRKEGNTSMVNWNVRIGDFSLRSEPIQLRLEVPMNYFMNVILVASPATAKQQDGTN